MKNIMTVMRKEFARFFYDKRMITMALLPAVLIFAVYSFMGSALETAFAPDEDHNPWVYAVNIPDSITPLMQEAGMSVYHIQASEIEGMKELLSLKTADTLIVFPPGFDALVDAYDAQKSTVPAPNIELYFNSTNPNSSNTYMQIYSMLDAYESTLANKFDINRPASTETDEQFKADLATAEDVTASIISSMLPMLLMIFLYSGCMGLALESITGEKERGTLATLLVSPLKRSQLAIGKILSLACLSFISGAASAMATILSLPNLMGGSAGEMVDAGIYSAVDYLLLAFVILSTLLLLVAMVSIVSALAKTVKEAGVAASPLMIVVMLIGVTGMFGGSQTEPVYFLVPLYNSVQSMSGIFSLEYSFVNIALTIVSNLAYAFIGGFVLTKMFNSEKIMFSR